MTGARSILSNPLLILVSVSMLVLGLGVDGHGFAKDINPPFSIQHENETAWLAKPNGERFFSLGVCVVSQNASREEFNPANPGYAAWQHYADSNL